MTAAVIGSSTTDLHVLMNMLITRLICRICTELQKRAAGQHLAQWLASAQCFALDAKRASLLACLLLPRPWW